MLDQQFKKYCTKIKIDEFKKINCMQYIMNYGEYTINYEFYLN